jgi:hypothetical protein
MRFSKVSIGAIEIRGSLIKLCLTNKMRLKTKLHQALLDKQNAIENEITSLEQHLDEL